MPGSANATDLNRYFPHKLCINLRRRRERLARMQRRFARHGIELVERVEARDGRELSIPPNWRSSAEAYGCLRSHVNAVRTARERGWDRVLILEDDVVFDEDLNAKFSSYLGEVPPAWDMLHFGCTHLEQPDLVAAHVGKLRRSLSTYAFALSSTIYDAFVETNERGMQPIDRNNLDLQDAFECYCFVPHLAWVESGFSDISGRYVNHWFLDESRFLPGVDEAGALWDRTAVIVAARGRRSSAEAARAIVHAVRDLASRCTVVVVAQGGGGAGAFDWLPAGCRGIWLDDDEPFDKGKCFNAGFLAVGADKDTFVFAHESHVLEHTQLLLNLVNAGEFEFISLCEEAIVLDERQTHQYLRDGRIDDSRELALARFSNPCAGPCLFTREAFLRVGGWREGDSQADRALGLAATRMLRSYRSRGSVVQLCQQRGD